MVIKLVWHLFKSEFILCPQHSRLFPVQKRYCIVVWGWAMYKRIGKTLPNTGSELGKTLISEGKGVGTQMFRK